MVTNETMITATPKQRMMTVVLAMVLAMTAITEIEVIMNAEEHRLTLMMIMTTTIIAQTYCKNPPL